MRTTSTIIRILAVVLSLAFPATGQAQLGGTPGSPTRMGFGARGIGMGNAMTAVSAGGATGYYNPALLPFTTRREASATAGFLSLDRSLNFLGFAMPLPPMAGIGAGIINSGVSHIDGRDGDGNPTGQLRTAENTAFLAFGIRFPAGSRLGGSLKLLYAHLYTDMTSTTVGVDLGASYRITQDLRAGLTVKDIGAKYKWDSSVLYGEQSGLPLQDNFPRLTTLGLAYTLLDSTAQVAVDLQASQQSTLHLRVGAEYMIVPELTVRAGIDRIDLKEKGNGIRPSAGLTLTRPFAGLTPSIEYAFVAEPFSGSPIHLISIGLCF